MNPEGKVSWSRISRACGSTRSRKTTSMYSPFGRLSPTGRAVENVTFGWAWYPCE